MKCFVCSENRDAIRYRKIGFYQHPGLPICGTCDVLSDDELTKKMARKEEKEKNESKK